MTERKEPEAPEFVGAEPMTERDLARRVKGTLARPVAEWSNDDLWFTLSFVMGIGHHVATKVEGHEKGWIFMARFLSAIVAIANAMQTQGDALLPEEDWRHTWRKVAETLAE